LGQNAQLQVSRGWDLESNNNHEFECASKVKKCHARPKSNGQGKYAPYSWITNQKKTITIKLNPYNKERHENRWNIRSNNKWCWKRDMFFKEDHQVMEHSFEFTFWSHLNKKIRFTKMGPKVCLQKKNVVMIKWNLDMQKCGICNVAKLTQTKHTPFWNGILDNNYWYWFKWKQPKVNIW